MSKPSHQTDAIGQKPAAQNEPASAATSAAEIVLAEVWAGVLQRDDISATANFFDLGGDSLKALEVISRIQQRLGVELPLLAFFEDPTIAHLAAVVGELGQNAPELPSATTTQAKVAQIWKEVLQREEIGPGDNFFDMGGDSLKALEVISQVQASLGVELPLLAFFEDPTVVHTAAVIEQIRGSELPPSVPGATSSGNALLSFPQLTFFLLQQSDPAGYLYNEPRVLRIHGQLDADVLRRALNQMCLRHDSMRARFVTSGVEPTQVIPPESDFELPTQDLSGMPLPEAERAAMEIARAVSQRPFDLTSEPAIRGQLLKLSPEDYVLIFVIHHTLSDGHTCAIFFQELSAIYNGLLSESSPGLLEPVPQYQEYASWERGHMAGERLETELDYWKSKLKNAPRRLELPTDHRRPSIAGIQGQSRSILVPAEILDRLKTFAQNNATTLFTVLMAGLRILLHRWTEQPDIVIGTVVSNRSRAGTERMLGCFLNFLPLRGAISEVDTGQEVVTRERQLVADAFSHQAPFVKIAEAVAAGRGEANPIYNVALLLQNFPEMKFAGTSFSAEFVEQEVETALLDLRFIAQEVTGGLRVDCDFRTELFDAATIAEVLQGYLAALNSLTQEPLRAVSQFAISSRLVEKRAAAHRRDKKHSLAVASTFTAEPIESSLAFWMQELGINAEIHFAPYNQAFQQVLDPASMFAQNRDGFNILLLRPTDWQRFEEHADDAAKREKIERSLSDMARMLKAHPWPAPILVCCCPPEKKYSAEPTWKEFLDRSESRFAAELAVPGIHVISSTEIAKLYPVGRFEDEYADAIGHIPYTAEFFSALGATLARRIFALRSAPRKVIVLDCDNTLWNGVCGEEGPAVRVDAPRRALQEFMLAQMKAGMLLCLCSKNAEEDVDAVFAQNPDMVLRREHIVAQRVNWNSKPENLRQLASALQLGLESFIFVDDNPIECAEVQAQLPEVLTLLLPQDDQEIPQFLGNVWAFDHWKVTEEDAKRTVMYRQNAEREQLRQDSATLDAFLAGLELKLDIRPMQTEDVARVSQLTERTNQFNFTTIRRSEAAVTEFMDGGGECLTVNLADRFGDYGLVGVMLYRTSETALRVDTFLLSCRALGRKVEHRMLARLGEIARERGLSWVEASLVPTKKNQPAADFLNGAGLQFRSQKDGGYRFAFPAEYAAGVHHMQGAIAPAELPSQDAPKVAAPPATQIGEQNRLITRIARELTTVSGIAHAMHASRIGKSRSSAFAAPRTPIEEILAEIWAQRLSMDAVGIHDDFFALGGHSLLAVQVIARVRQMLGVEMPLRAMFDAPTIAEFAARVEAARNTNAKQSVPPLKRAPRAGPVPLSYAQQRLWFIDQLEPGNPLYNISAMYRLKGPLNVDAMQRTINEIVCRHEALRTTFATQDGQAVQIIAPSLQVPLRIEVREDLPVEAREAEIQRLAKREASEPFDLAKGPLLRFSLLKLAEDEHVLVVILHHIVGDGWSGSMLATEMAALYRAFSQNQPSPLPELVLQYADFAIWQREWMQDEALDARTEYWKKQLAGAPPVLELPSDRPRPAVQAHRGAILTHTISNELLERAREFSHAEGATLFMTLLSAFQLLLSRYSGQEDIVVGSTIASRNYSEIEPLIGFFVNTLAMRTDLSGDPTFRELLARVKQVALDAYAHQDIPFEKLVEELQPERSLSYNPIFQVLFGLQNQPRPAFEASGLAVQRESIHSSTSLFDMSWFAFETAEGLLLRVEYDTDLFDEETIARSIGHFKQLLESITAYPERRISELPLLTAEERHRVLVEFNNNAADYRTDIRLHEFFVEQAQRTPEAIAIICGDANLTYRELDERSNQVARHLLSHGAAPDVLMGVFCERTPDLIVGILGILKSGSAYVPLDPAYPKERIANILEDAKVPVVLTQESLIGELPNFAGKAICLDSDWEQIEGESPTTAPIATTPENLAYVLFTSGSTGRPKGVALEHRSAATFVQWAQTVFTPAELSGVLFSTSACFDLSIFEMFVPLSVGGTVIVVQNALFLPSDEARDHVTLINTVPSAMAELVHMGAVPKSVKTINLAGEALADTLVNEIYAETSVQKVYNLYGPTEDTTYSTYTLTAPSERVTIGKPLPNSQAYVLDARGNPQPVGVPGELFLAGAGLARGYFGRAELTAERFVTNPFGQKPSRMYRTGDLCRWLPGGNLEYLGRLDHQVKLRGFRIELGEIEAVLARHPDVRQSLVLAREDQPGMKRLVAYVVPQPGTTPGPEELREHVKQSLPEFMVPASVVFLEAFPLTPNGKINRKALPAPDAKPGAGESYVAPRTPVEEQVTAIWKQVLRLENVGVFENFFSLGGHSLLATQVISRLRQSAGADLPLRAIFEAPTIAELAPKVEEALAASGRHTQGIPRVPRTGPMPLSFAQQRLWFLNQLEPNNPLYNIPIAIGMSGKLHFEALERALNEIVCRHEVLRTTFELRDNQPVQITAPVLRLHVPVVDLSHLPKAEQEAEVKRLAIEGAKQIFDLETGPLFGATVLKLAPEDHVLLLNMHHIVSDGWSLWQFIREIAPLYGAFVEGKPSPLSEPPIQYADYAVWQRQWMSGDVLKQHLDYWTRQLHGAPEVFELPADRPRPPVQTYRGATIMRKLPLELLNKLRSFSQGESATLFMALLAAYQTLLFRYTGQPDLVIGSPIAGRNQADIEGLIGFFVNAIVMRTDLSGNPSFRELVHRVRTTALGAYAHQDLPFEKLVEVMQPERDLTRTPIFQVWFALQNAPRADFRLPGVELRTIDVHSGTSKFDLGLFVAEKADGLACLVEYSTDLFDAATIERFHDHFRVLLEAIVADPDQAITDLPILCEDERHQVVVEWNRTQMEYDHDVCLHRMIEQQVEKTPDAPALVFESQQLSYRELNARANQLAHHLRKLGVGPEILAGVCTERSIEMVVALLAVMKAGGAYVPLDPDHPRDRLAMVIEDAAPPVLLTQEHLLDVIPPQSAPVFCLDRDWHTLNSEPTGNPESITGGKDQAYAIFTSGSTGKPKGVPNVHEGIVNRLLWMQHAYGLDSTDRVLQKTPYSFDVSVWEFFWPLMTGACLVVAKPEGHKDPNYLIDLIVRQRITTMHFVPSMLRIFLETGRVESCSSLRRVICSGEALPADLETRFFERLQCELHNLYGPTEASVDVTYWQCQPGSGRSSVPIGRPVWNTQIYILDEQLRPAPIGVPGELHIGGVQLARGYLNRPQLTAEKFIRDPFSSEPGARLYKTGDLSRFLPDGNIEYLGRLDHQVKIRGFRIELGEIETTLNEQPGVRQSVVLAREDEPGDKRLAAYIVVDPSYRGPQTSESQEDLGAEQVSQWAMTFDEAYSRGGSVEDATFNIVGWNSSYTLQPIPAEEMRVWVETTVERILSLPSERVWEIGCGTGLLLFRIAPKTSLFHGTDVSQKALDFLQQQMQRPELRLPQVTLQRAGAHEFAAGAKDFDSIVINSVIQYFPNIEYLISVIEGAVKALRPGGAMFIGDVRNFALLECFHASVQLFQAQDSATGAEIWDRAQKGLKQEGELVVDPAFFLTLPQRIPQIRQVEIHLKRGRALNELTRFRYDVVLHAGEQPAPEAECQWLDWNRERLTSASLRERLAHASSDLIGVAGVPNPRLVREVAAAEMLASNKGITAEELRKELDNHPLPGFELEELWEIERSLPFAVEIRWSHKALSACDVLFRRKSTDGRVINPARVRFPGESAVAQPLERYATNPLRQRYAGALIADVRQGLAAKLPEYMVPAHFVLLDSMPLSPNGKVDRKALPAPDRSQAAATENYSVPRTPVEEMVMAIWMDVLRLPRVGIRDDFFELGGHSLNATQVVARVRETFQLDLPVRALFESPTVENLAKTIEGLQRTEQGAEAPEMARVPRDREIPLSFAQQRLWFLDQMDPGNHLYNVPRAIRLKGKLNLDAMERAVNDLIARHEILRTSYTTINDHPVQKIAAELTIPLPLFDFSSLPEGQREVRASQLVQAESEKGFDLSSHEILRGFVIKMAEEDYVLFLNTHHIATDGWSSGVMVNDLSAFYASALENKPADISPLEIQYADYAVWQRDWLQGEALARQLGYWKKELEGAPPVLSLPTDHPRPAVQTFRGAVYESSLPKDLLESLRILGRRQSATLFMTMLSGFDALLYHYTGQPDLVLGTDLANRVSVQTEAIIGFFVNLLVLRTDLSGNPTFEELIKRVREVSLRAYAHQDLPFDKLVEELRPERTLTHSPLVQVLFVQQNTPRSTGNFPGLQIERFGLDVPSKFDMALFMNESEGQVIGRWVYNPDLFDASTIARMANLYETLLRAVVAEPNVPLTRIYETLREAETRLREAGQKSFHETSLRKLKGARRKAAMAPIEGPGEPD